MADRRIYTGDDINSGFLKWRIEKHVSSVFAGATTNAHGSLGERPTYTIFTVTGDVILQQIIAIINTTVDDAGGDNATIEVGVPTRTASFVAASQASLLLDGNLWLQELDGSTIVGAGAFSTGGAQHAWDWVINDGGNIVETTKTADVTAGQIDYYCIWAPLEVGATLIEAGTLS